MTAYEISLLLKKLGVRETKAETYPNTYSIVNGSSFLAQQVNNRDSASWKKAEYIILTESHVSKEIIDGWKKLTEREPLPSAIQKLCVPTSDDKFDVYDSQGKLIESDSLDRVIRHTPDIVDFLNESETSVNSKSVKNVSSFTPAQIIYYGVPGCGKSKKIMDLLDVAKQRGEITDEEKQVVRVVFHPEYTNADFVGQVMPVVKPAGGVDYDFAAGPFTRILARAYANPTKPYFLVIEEINRGNAAAIFGEIFQLLDRHKKGESDSVGGNLYTAGWSKYFVDHVDVNGKISAEIAETEYGSDEEKPTVNFTANTAIRLPPNLSIYATMNTSDQNVFTLDNAFKRRFDSELVKNTLDGEQHKTQRETKIENTGVTWGTFWEKVNDLILEKNTSMISSEDKRLGAYFIIGEEKTDDAGNKYREISRKLFGEKVLEYLWDDAFKYKRSTVFKNECKSVESLIENFEEGGFAAIFKDGILGL